MCVYVCIYVCVRVYVYVMFYKHGKLRIQGRMQSFEQMSQSALNHVSILQKYRTQKVLQIPLKYLVLQNEFNMLVAKQWKFRISVPMS